MVRENGDNLLFEGAQGAMLDVDLGTYPYVTSSRYCGWYRCGQRFWANLPNYGGITKAYAATCWFRPISNRTI